MKRCPVCSHLNFDDVFLCTSCGNPFPRKKKGYFHTIRWHLLALALVLGMMGLLKYRGGEIFRDFGGLMSLSSPGRVEISRVRIYNDLSGKKVVEGNLRNLCDADFQELNLEVIAYNAEGKKLGRYDHPVPKLPMGKFTSFLIKLPSFEGLNHAHFNLKGKNEKELYLINRTDANVPDLKVEIPGKTL